jgi:hypothetical protein
MTYLYEYPQNYPTSAVRLYRFPEFGVRDSKRLNLLLQAIVGDLKVLRTYLSDIEDMVASFELPNYPDITPNAEIMEQYYSGHTDATNTVDAIRTKAGLVQGARLVLLSKVNVPVIALAKTIMAPTKPSAIPVTRKDLATRFMNPSIVATNTNTNVPRWNPLLTVNPVIPVYGNQQSLLNPLSAAYAGVLPVTPDIQNPRIDLVVPINMNAGTVWGEAGAKTFDETITPLNDGDYDGATYYFEVVFSNSKGSSINASLVNQGTGDVIKTISMDASQTEFKRKRSTAFSPVSGACNYALKLDAGVEARVERARIVVVQSSATKTRIQIPLYASSQFDAVYGQSYSVTQYCNKWLKTNSNWDTVASCTIEGYVKLGTANTTYIGLFNATDNTQVSGAEASGGTGYVKSSTFDWSASNFHDGDEFELRYKVDSQYYANYIYTAYLYMTLTTLNKAEISQEVMGWHQQSFEAQDTFYRSLFEGNSIHALGSVQFQSVGYNYLNSSYPGVCKLYSDDDDAGYGTITLEKTNTHDSTTLPARQLKRQSFTPTANKRYLCKYSGGITSAFLIIPVSKG